MTDLIRLTYASKATADISKVQHDLIDILYQSRQFNAKHGISGVLFYHNHCFFQCLEGQRSQLNLLYHKITADGRHTDVVQLACEPITKAEFKHWNMKYVVEDSRIRHFFLHHYGQLFNPYLLNDGLHQKFIELLLDSPESTKAMPQLDVNFNKMRIKKPFYASRNFGLFVILPIIVICLVIYVIA